MMETALVARVADVVAAESSAGDDLALARSLRERFPGTRFVVCADDDIPLRVKPAAENAICRLYFMDTGEHCVRFADTHESASGLVVGLICDDE